jgi:hypothetical protein
MEATHTHMAGRGMKISNEYAKVLQPRYGAMPKAVIAAVAVSLLLKEHEGNWSAVYDAFVKEWATLHQNGIVPQKPLITNKSQEPNA